MTVGTAREPGDLASTLNWLITLVIACLTSSLAAVAALGGGPCEREFTGGSRYLPFGMGVAIRSTAIVSPTLRGGDEDGGGREVVLADAGGTDGQLTRHAVHGALGLEHVLEQLDPEVAAVALVVCRGQRPETPPVRAPVTGRTRCAGH